MRDRVLGCGSMMICGREAFAMAIQALRILFFKMEVRYIFLNQGHLNLKDLRKE